MILVDSGYLIALAEPRDSLHAVAMRWSRTVNEPLLLTDYILIEVINHLSRTPQQRAKSHLVLDEIRLDLQYVLVPASQDLLQQGLLLHRRRPDKAWSLTDCISFTLMRDRGVTQALAHDIHFTQAGFEALMRENPTG